MALEVALTAFIAAFAAFGIPKLWAPERSPFALWLSGWISAGTGGVLLVLAPELRWLDLLTYPLGTLFATLVLAGTLVLVDRPATRPLVLAGLAFGGARAAAAAAVGPAFAYGLGLAVEPLVVLAAAPFAMRFRPGLGRISGGTLLAASLVAMAAAGAFHLAHLMRTGAVSQPLLVLWVVATPPLLGIQFAVGALWAEGALRRAREALEATVHERTAALAASEERYRVVSELSSDLSFGFRVEPGGRIAGEWVTDAFRRMLGYEPAEMRGDAWLALIHPDDRAQVRRRFAAVAAAGTGKIPLRVVRRDGEVRWLDVSESVTRGADGTLRVVGAARDVTDARAAEEAHRRLEQRVREAQRLESLGFLSGGVAHGFNNLLSVILGNARLGLAELPRESPLRRRLERILGAAEHGNALTEKMLVYAGRGSLERKPLDLSRLAEEAVDLARPGLSASCRLRTKLEPGVFVEGDESQLRQVVLHLVENAGEAIGDAGGEVTVSAAVVTAGADDLAAAQGAAGAAPGRYACLEVADTGPGMDAETRRRAFEPFFTTRFAGRGLGLSAVLGIVRGHGGVVSLASEVGRGTSLRVLLPVEAQVAARAPEEARVAAAAAERGRGRVLVVDDEEHVLELAAEFLARAGREVVTAAGGREGLARFAADPDGFEAVVVDLAMPDLDGEAVAREILALRPATRLVLASGYNPEFAASHYPALVPAPFLRKPYEPEELVAAVEGARAGRSA